MNEKDTITIDLTAAEGVYLMELINDRMEALALVPRTATVIHEVQSLHNFVMKITPQVKAMAAKERGHA